MADGILHTTEPFTYIPYKEVALSDLSEVTSLYIKDNSSLILEICEYDEQKSQTTKPIGNQAVQVNKIKKPESRELTLPTIYGADAVIKVTFKLVNDFLDLFDEPEQKMTKRSRLRKVFEGDSFKLTKLLPLLHQCVLSLSPLALMKKQFFDFIYWKNPHKTFLFSVCLTISILLGRKMLALGLLIFGLVGQFLIPSIVRYKPLEEDTVGSVRIYKRNMKFLKVIY